MTKKTPYEKFQTKLNKLKRENTWVNETRKKIKFSWKKFFSYNKISIDYGNWRYYPTQTESVVSTETNYKIIISDYTIKKLNSNLLNPPKHAETILRSIKNLFWNHITTFIIGTETNSFDNGTLSMTISTFNSFLGIIQEEGKEKSVRINNRLSPFLQTDYWINLDEATIERDYGLLLSEIIASWKVSSSDIQNLCSQLSPWDNINYILERDIPKQVKWLIDWIQEIVDHKKITTSQAKILWNKLFGFTKLSIKWPEKLMEMILTKYWKHTIFGVPVLLNTNKYIINQWEEKLPKSQFDIILINHLSEIEIVELKKTDTIVLDYEPSRGKFYPSKELSIAISQAERYLSAVHKDNDDEYLINWMKLRDYINNQISWTHEWIESCRPRALIVLGSRHSLSKEYDELDTKTKNKVTKEQYERNRDLSYREIKSSFKNIDIVTYSELLDIARTRLAIEE